MTEIKIEDIQALAKEAGAAILEIYGESSFEGLVDMKADRSPLTAADKASHNILVKGLPDIMGEIPILSEEGKHMPYGQRRSWKLFWLVDPLDGTKEFLKRNGEFTVNIALISSGYPVFGLIYAPVTDTCYIGETEKNMAFKITEVNKLQEIRVNNKAADRVAVQSRSHASDEESTLMQQYAVTSNMSVGSSLKFCMIAEGRADIYYRHGPTMEWDTGAGQAIVEAAGGSVVRYPSGERFYYNKEDLKNESFLVKGFSE